MITQRKESIWENDSGRVLVRVSSECRAIVVPSECSATELRDLAEACCLAADAMDLIAETKVRIAE